jgi:MFS family permease
MNILNNPKKYFWITLFQSSGILAPIVTLFYLHRGLDFQQIFILFTIIVIAIFLFELPTGIIADKFGRKTSISIGLFLYLIFSIALIFAHSFIFFAILYFFLGISITFTSGSDEALIYDSLKQKKKQKDMKKWMGKILSAKFIPLIIMAPLGSLIAKDLTSIQFIIVILADAFFILIAFILSLSLIEPKSSSGPHEIRSPIKLMKSAFYHIKNNPTLVKLFLNKTLILIPGMHIFAILWQPYLKEVGIPVAFFGFLIAISALIMWVVLTRIEKVSSLMSEKKFLFFTAVIPLLSFIIASFFKSIWVGVIFYFTIRTLVWLREPIFSKFMNEHIESHNRATVLSSLSMIDSLFDVVIFLSAGFITNISVSYSFLFSAGLMLLALIFFRVKNEHIKVKS